MVLRILGKIERWSSVFNGEVEYNISGFVHPITPRKCHSRVVLSGENSEPKYSNYLCFVVSVQTNKLMSEYGGIGYSDSQQETYDLIKSLHDGVLGYRRIAHHLNLKNIKTLTGKEWNGSLVFAIMKRNKQRVERLTRRNENFAPEISKFEVRWERNW